MRGNLPILAIGKAAGRATKASKGNRALATVLVLIGTVITMILESWALIPIAAIIPGAPVIVLVVNVITLVIGLVIAIRIWI